jgi:hypothetical protein
MALLENRPLPPELLNWVAEQGYDMDKLLGALGSDIANTMDMINMVSQPIQSVQLFHI